jgi:hypothetical protein
MLFISHDLAVVGQVASRVAFRDGAEEPVEQAGEQRGGRQREDPAGGDVAHGGERRPLPLALMVPATPELRMWVVETGRPKVSAAKMVPMATRPGAGALA